MGEKRQKTIFLNAPNCWNFAVLDSVYVLLIHLLVTEWVANFVELGHVKSLCALHQYKVQIWPPGGINHLANKKRVA